ncbi:MAG: hypothetical protein ACN6P1_05585 [Pseudomonas sp.]|uniref:hypothetical protein n=1 Tax=Pseudomonas sp. TaxID=306 RepID=UPI003D0AAFA4
MMRAPFDENPIIACGWPWHGLVEQNSLGQYQVTLPNGMVRGLQGGQLSPSANSHLFDMGLPDVPDEELEAAGGAWWGRAVLRSDYRPPHDSGYFGNTLPEVRYGGVGRGGGEDYSAILLPGAPLVLTPDEGEPYRVFARVRLAGTTLRVSVRRDDAWVTVERTVSAAGVGQGTGQPACAGYAFPTVSAPQSAVIDDANPGAMRCWVRDFTRNRILLGVHCLASTAAPAATPPLGTGSTLSANNWPWNFWPLLGLLEVEVLPGILDAPVPGDYVVLRVLEDRRAALGDPQYAISDVNLGGGDRQYEASWTQTGALLTGFYDQSGVLQTVRLNRVQTSTLHRRRIPEGEGTYRQQDTGRTTALELIDTSGAVVDAFTLTERMTETERGTTVRVVRRVSATGQDDDVVDSGEITGTATWASVLDVYPPGYHYYVPVLAQIYTVDGVQIIAQQDIRVLYALPHGNRAAGLAFTREPFAHSTSAPVFIQLRPMALQGAATLPLVEYTLTKSNPAQTILRGLFYFGGNNLTGPSVIGVSYNPATGQVARKSPAQSVQPTWI